MNRFRTLFRVLMIDNEGIWCVLPAWHSDAAIRITSLPFAVTVDQRFYGTVFLGANDPDDLRPDEFEHHETRSC